ncbi:hypothetical protein PR048_008818, partial [Dryococelus australis]
MLNIQIQAAESGHNQELRHTLKIKQEIHHRKVQLARYVLETTRYQAKMINVLLCFHLTCKKIAAMHVWDESVASRRAQEIGSCVMKYLNTHEHKENIIAWSDSCRERNRNIKMAAMWMHIVQSSRMNVKEVCHKFAEPGHSYLPNNSDFGDIDRKFQYHPEIYAPTQWCEVISNSRVKKNKFEVVQMNKEDVKNTTRIEVNMVNTKNTTTGDKVEWFNIKEMRFTKNKPGIMEYKFTHNSLIGFNSIYLNKRLTSSPANLGSLVLPILYPQGRELSEEKLKDVRSLLQFVPPVYHAFYNGLQTFREQKVLKKMVKQT